MVQQLLRNGDTLVVALPIEAVELMGLREGSEVSVAFDRQTQQLRLWAGSADAADVDAEFARELAEFIEQYRPALLALAR